MANGQITIHQSHLPRHFIVGVPVGLAGSSYEKAMEMAYCLDQIPHQIPQGILAPKRHIPQRSDGRDTEIHCQFGPNSTVTADAGFRGCVAACEAHLEDLRIEHAPLRSLTRAEMRRGD
jgi:hypothetical protein